MSFESSKLLRLPEILLQIFEQLEEDTTSLRKACLVNSTWFEEATNVLWRDAPVTALMNIEPSRRQIYAGKFYSLSFYSDEGGQFHNHLRNLKFPRLKHLSADSFRPDDGNGNRVHVDQYFQPSLEEVALYGGSLTECILNYTSSELPRLRHILIDSLPSNVDDTRFLNFLQSIPSLDSMSFMFGMDHVITDQVFKYLVSRQNLTDLRLHRVFKRATIEEALELALSPFIALQYFQMRIESDSISSLAELLSRGSIKILRLDIEDDKGSILDYVSSLTQLQSLQVTYHKSREIPQKEMMTIRSLCQLKTLGLRSKNDNEAIHSFDTKDGDMRELTAQFKQLQGFFFDVQCNMSISAIIAIGKNCPRLEKLHMLGAYDLGTLAHTPEVLFPALQELELGSARLEDVPYLYSTVEDVSRSLSRHAPKLKDLTFVNGDEFSELVEAKFDS
ncbi:hypothetical protein MMC14_008992 [Varicellaria rhodocarpa]|nr:hypothetical protein [Varicellaria rhodocarpa]